MCEQTRRPFYLAPLSQPKFHSWGRCTMAKCAQQYKEKHAQNLWCAAPLLRVKLLDKGTEWIVGRSTESVGLMYSADCGLTDSWTHRLTELQTCTRNIYSWNTVLCWHTACVSSQVRETDGLADSEYIRPNWWASFYLELHTMLASFPGLPRVSSSVCVQYNTWRWKSAKNEERQVYAMVYAIMT